MNKMTNLKYKLQKGQVVLIVLLASAVIMTLGLSAAKRTVVDTKIDTDEELLKQAFNTAESGVDYYLATGATGVAAYQTSDNNSNADISVSPVGLSDSLVSDGVVIKNDPYLFWLVGHNDDGSVKLANTYTGSSVDICVDTTFKQKLKIDYFYKGANYSVKRDLHDFASGSNCITDFATPSTTLLLAVTPIGESTNIKVVGKGDTFPIQGEKITSVGRAGNVSASTNANQVSSQVRVFNQYKVPPFMLDAITAGDSVLSN
jgi:hypothetical protein